MKLISKEIKKWLFSKFNKYNEIKNIELLNEYLKLIQEWLEDNSLEIYDSNLFHIKFYLFMYDDNYFFNNLNNKDYNIFDEFYMKYSSDINEIFFKIKDINENNGYTFNKDNKFTYNLIQFIYNEINGDLNEVDYEDNDNTLYDNYDYII